MPRTVASYLGLRKIPRVELLFVLICGLACVALALLPSGFEGAAQQRGQSVRARVTAVDDSQRHVIGLTNIGEQIMRIEILSGDYRGRSFDTVNHFLGKLDFDKVYREGDTVFAVIDSSGGEVVQPRVIDRYRLNIQGLLVAVFILLLVGYAGWTGLKAIVSFFFTALLLWKVMLPGLLKYFDPIAFSLLIVAVLTGVIIFLVAGFTRKGAVAFLGAFAGVLLTCALSVVFGRYFRIPGEIKPFAETLLYTGFPALDLAEIFLAGIFIASSGAVMDISMDVSASMAEIVAREPRIGALELIASGFRVGRAVIGTMTTTLLLAYSGGYSTLLMVFIAQGIPLGNILNIQYVSAEILHTVVGSFGLVSVAPLTALIGGALFTRKAVLRRKAVSEGAAAAVAGAAAGDAAVPSASADRPQPVA